MNFKIGDIVTLVSFDKKMVISKQPTRENPDVCYCMWFDKKDKLHEKLFFKELLVRVQEKELVSELTKRFLYEKSLTINNELIVTIDLTDVEGSTKSFLIDNLTKNDICISPEHSLLNKETKLNNAYPPTLNTNNIRGKLIPSDLSTLFVDNSLGISSIALNSYIEFLLASRYPLKYVVLLR